jgi:hypothetical protein
MTQRMSLFCIFVAAYRTDDVHLLVKLAIDDDLYIFLSSPINYPGNAVLAVCPHIILLSNTKVLKAC